MGLKLLRGVDRDVANLAADDGGHRARVTRVAGMHRLPGRRPG